MESVGWSHSEEMRTSYHRIHVKLGKKDRQQISMMLTKGRESARVLRRALILRQLDQGQTAAQVHGAVLCRWRHGTAQGHRSSRQAQ